MRIFWTSLFLLAGSNGVFAHYHILLPDRQTGKVGDEIKLRYAFGHPFEHEFFDAELPETATIYTPDGKRLDVKGQLKAIRIDGTGGKKVTAFELTFKPEQRGDHVIVFTSPRITIEGEKLPVLDTVKVVIHVQTQQGWDRAMNPLKPKRADMIPLTRPYALRSGMLFRAEFRDIDRDKPGSPEQVEGRPPGPVPYAEVEIERYNPAALKMLPPEEHITYTARTDSKGVLATTLPDPGWWAITGIRKTPNAVHRCTLWVQVDDKIPFKPAE